MHDPRFPGDPMPPIHPGEVLREEFLEPLGISAYALAKALHVSRPTINDLTLERRGITANLALRLGRYFGTTPNFWLNLQMHYDLRCQQQALEADLAAIEPLKRAG